MAFYVRFGVCLILVIILNLARCSFEASDTNVELSIVQNSTNFLIENREYEMSKEELSGGASKIALLTYCAGNRENGDKVVATESGTYSWNTTEDRRLVIAYPKAGQGALITYIRVLVEQSTSSGKSAITKGGLGFRYVEFYVDAYKTTYLKYTVEIFGLA